MFMDYKEPIKAKVHKDTNKVSVSIASGEDLVITKKISVDQFRKVMAHLNSVLYDIDHK